MKLYIFHFHHAIVVVRKRQSVRLLHFIYYIANAIHNDISILWKTHSWQNVPLLSDNIQLQSWLPIVFSRFCVRENKRRWSILVRDRSKMR